MDQSNPMTLKKYHLALLRPSVLQILRAQGYYGCRPSVLDSVTELAGEYMAVLAREAHRNAEHNHPWDQNLTIPDVRQALEYVGALVPDDMVKQEDCGGDEDSRGIETFKRWVEGPKNSEINRVAEAFQQSGQLLEPPDGERVDQIHRDYLSRKLALSRWLYACLVC
jgi:transcription initiation factor TFIID subunit 3